MPLDPAAVCARVHDAAARDDAPGVAVAYSGGIDSTVLLDIVCAGATLPVRALHVDHALQGEQPDWRRVIAENCRARSVPLEILRAAAEPARGDSIEAVARAARYDALGRALHRGELLLLAPPGPA